MREISVDLPAFGNPTSPTSASSFSSSRSRCSSPGVPGFMLGRRLVGGGGEPRIAPSAAAAFRDDETLARLGEVEQPLAGVLVVDDGADGHRQLDRLAVVPCPVAALAVTAALGFVLGVEAEMEQGVVVLLATRTTSPPRPPSPPLGPPRGTNFSRRNARQPLPPSPAFTRILTSSINMELSGKAERPHDAAGGDRYETLRTGGVDSCRG